MINDNYKPDYTFYNDDDDFYSQIFREARRVAPSIIYLPRIESLWNTTSETLKATFMSLVNDLPPPMPLLLFATSDVPLSWLPDEVSSLFSIDSEQVRLRQPRTQGLISAPRPHPLRRGLTGCSIYCSRTSRTLFWNSQQQQHFFVNTQNIQNL